MPKKDYYKERIKEINLLIDQKKYKEALDMVSTEIAAPYIPQEYMENFEQLYISLSEVVNVEAIEKKYNVMGKTQLLTEAYNGKSLNVNVLSFFLAKFSSEIDKMDLAILDQMFSNKQISNDLKIFALEQIKLSDINHDFTFFNNMINKEMVIGSQSNFELDNDQYYFFVKETIEKELFKEPSLMPLASYTLKLCYEYYFGSRPPYTKQELAINILQYIRSHFDDSIKVDNSFINWVNNLFSFKKLKN